MIRFYLISAIYCFMAIVLLLFVSGAALLISLLSLIYLATMIWGVSSIRSQMFVKTFNFSSKIKDKVAITYDDGPNEENTPKLLEILKKYDAKASFFLIGENVVKYSDVAKKISKEGHTIGNHTFFHDKTFPFKSVKQIKKEILDTFNEIAKIAPQETRYFRPPFGVTNPLIAKAISKMNLKIIGWNIRSYDTCNDEKEVILKRVIGKLKGGDIILLHDRTKHVCWLTEEILKHLKKNNIEAVTIEELLFA